MKDAHIKRGIENKLIFPNVWHYIIAFIKFNNFGTRRLNGPRSLFHSFCRTTQCIFEPLRVYEPSFNMEKYSIYICISYNTYKSALPDIYARRPRASAYISGKAHIYIYMQGRRKQFTTGPAKLDPKHYSIKCMGGR